MTIADVNIFTNIPYFEFILKGLVSGILSGYLLIYGMRPAVPYPEIILEFFEHKWLFVVLLIINYYIFIWDYNCGALLLLCIIALMFDYVVFTDKGLKKVSTIVYKNNDKQINNEPVFVKKLPLATGVASQDTFENAMIKDISGMSGNIEREYIPGQPAPFLAI